MHQLTNLKYTFNVLKSTLNLPNALNKNNTLHLIQDINEIQNNGNLQQVTFNTDNRCTSIPMNEMIKIIQEKPTYKTKLVNSKQFRVINIVCTMFLKQNLLFTQHTLHSNKRGWEWKCQYLQYS
jgi:hypothetical protein